MVLPAVSETLWHWYEGYLWSRVERSGIGPYISGQLVSAVRNPDSRGKGQSSPRMLLRSAPCRRSDDGHPESQVLIPGTCRFTFSGKGGLCICEAVKDFEMRWPWITTERPRRPHTCPSKIEAKGGAPQARKVTPGQGGGCMKTGRGTPATPEVQAARNGFPQRSGGFLLL